MPVQASRAGPSPSQVPPHLIPPRTSEGGVFVTPVSHVKETAPGVRGRGLSLNLRSPGSGATDLDCPRKRNRSGQTA